MTEETPKMTEQTLRLTSLALWGSVFVFFIVGLMFLFEIIPSTAPLLIGGVMIVIASTDVLIIKWLTAKMRRDAGL